MVAKSYQSMTQMGEPFKESGRMYVKVRNEKTGTERKVRWYTESEYERMYNEPATTLTFKPQKEVLGFTNGYVTIFKGDIYANLDWFKASIARYCRWWGWYIISTEAIPCDLPCGLEPIRLDWKFVGKEDGNLKPENVVKSYVDTLLYDSTNSKFQGAIGERLELTLKVTAANKGENQYGSYTVHHMEDENGNKYIWTTSAKSWETGDIRHIKGTVKEHKVIKNVNTTILTRCTLVK